MRDVLPIPCWVVRAASSRHCAWRDAMLLRPFRIGLRDVEATEPGRTVRGEEDDRIVLVDGSAEKVLASRKRPKAFAPIFFTGPSWSPDGELITAAVADATGPSHVFAFRVSDGKETDLTPSGQAFIAFSSMSIAAPNCRHNMSLEINCYFVWPFFSIFVHVSRRVTVRLKTRAPGFESRSTQK